MKKLTAFVLALFVAESGIVEATCDLAIYSRYVDGTGAVYDNGMVVQGECTKSFNNGVYVNGWFSQSARNPGLDKTFGNEIDVGAGWGGNIAEKVSINLHAFYFDLANNRLLDGTDGDIINTGGTIHWNTTSTYLNGESYYGLGQRRFPNGWKIGVGIDKRIANMDVNVAVYRNKNLSGNGKNIKVGVQPSKPLAKFFGGEVRPTVAVYKPLGGFNRHRDTEVVIGIRGDW